MTRRSILNDIKLALLGATKRHEWNPPGPTPIDPSISAESPPPPWSSEGPRTWTTINLKRTRSDDDAM